MFSRNALSLVLTTMLSTPVLAQTVAEAAPTDEIVVTARKTSEKLQDVPLAITAFTAADIKSARIERIADVAKLTPGLNYTPLFGAQNQLPIIRGAAQTFGQLNVGVFLDGIYLSGKAGVDLELNDLERIEVVKGPQSALYGRNTFAGAINYITKRPSAELEANVEGTAATHGLFKGLATVSGPLSDTIRVRVGGFYRESDGFYRSAIDGGRVDFAKTYGGTGTVELAPSEDFTATLRVTYSNEDSGQPPSSVIRNNSALGTPAGGSATQQRNLLYIGRLPSTARNGVTVNTAPVAGLPGDSYGDREEAIRASGTLEYDFGGVTATSLTSYSRRDAQYTYDGDNTVCDRTGGCPNFGFPFAPAIPQGKSDFALSSNDGYFRDISQELRLSSSSKSRLEWLVGGFYYDNRNVGTDRGITLPGTLAITSYTAAAAAYKYPRTVLTTESYSLFGSATFHVTDAFGITGELRYEHEKQGFAQSFVNPTGTTGPAAVRPVAEQKFHFTTPRVIVNYQIEDDKLIYASYARGAKTGGFNTGLNILNNFAYKPEYSNNYEIGLKSDFLDRTFRLNVAGYYIDWNDQQAACQTPVTAGGSSTNRTYTCNVAASTIYGSEVEASARITENFTFAANYSFTHARYDSFIDDSLAQTLTLAGRPAINFNGKHLPYVPDHKFVLSPRLSFPVNDSFNLEARADMQYQSRTYVRADNFQNFGDKTVVDLRVGLRSEALSVQLFANNIFDNKSPVAGVRFFDSTNYSVSSPLVQGADRRQIGVTVGYTF